MGDLGRTTEPLEDFDNRRRDGYRTGKARRVDSAVLPVYARKIGLLVRDARIERDVSLAELAAAIGSQPSCITRIERGEKTPQGRVYRGPSVQFLVRIALALDMSPSELLP